MHGDITDATRKKRKLCTSRDQFPTSINVVTSEKQETACLETELLTGKSRKCNNCKVGCTQKHTRSVSKNTTRFDGSRTRFSQHIPAIFEGEMRTESDEVLVLDVHEDAEFWHTVVVVVGAAECEDATELDSRGVLELLGAHAVEEELAHEGGERLGTHVFEGELAAEGGGTRADEEELADEGGELLGARALEEELVDEGGELLWLFCDRNDTTGALSTRESNSAMRGTSSELFATFGEPHRSLWL